MEVQKGKNQPHFCDKQKNSIFEDEEFCIFVFISVIFIFRSGTSQLKLKPEVTTYHTTESRYYRNHQLDVVPPHTELCRHGQIFGNIF